MNIVFVKFLQAIILQIPKLCVYFETLCTHPPEKKAYYICKHFYKLLI